MVICFVGLLGVVQPTYSTQTLAQRAIERPHSQKIPLKNLLDEVASRYGVKFNHNAMIVKDVFVQNEVNITSVDQIEPRLNQVLSETELRVKKIDQETFVVRHKDAELQQKKNAQAAEQNVREAGNGDVPAATSPLISQTPLAPAAPVVLQQEVKVSGKVTDKETNTGMARVTVRLKGSRSEAITDNQGNYTITLPDAQGTLIFSFIGYRTLEAPIEGKTSLNVFMEVDYKLLEDVVVTALGVKKETKKLGYATSVVKGESMTQARETNMANALVGKVAGVNVSAPASGASGSSRVTIRGNTSISNDNQPLYVVNGIPIDNSNLGSAGMWGGFDAGDGISSLNPDDIESINVLKGATAAALYGSRAKNGVILISTKRGKGDTKGVGIEFNSNFVVENIRNYLEPQTSYGQGTKGLKPSDAQSARVAGLNAWGAKLDGSSVIQFDGVSRPYSAISTNLDNYYKTGATWTNTLGINGGSDVINYRFSFSDLSNTGVYPNSELNRKNFNASASFKITPDLTGEASVMYTKEKTSNRPGQSDSPGNGNFAAFMLPGNLNIENLKGPKGDGRTQYLGELTEFTDNPFVTNPYFAAYNFINETQKDRIIASASLKYNFTDWLFVQGRIGQDFYTFQSSSNTPTGTAYLAAGSNGNIGKNSITAGEVNADVLLSMDKKLTDDISLGASVGANLRVAKTETYGANGTGLSFPNVYNPNFAINRVPTYGIFQREVQSVYGSVELSYQEMFFLNATARNDWFSTVAVGNYSYLYPSVSGSFVFSELIPSSNLLTFGKLRVAYASVGADTDPYATKLYYNTNGAITGSPIGGFDNVLPNRTLKPLTVTEMEVGLEMRLFESRVSLDLAWYQKDTKDEIVTATISATSGFQSAIINNGKLRNTGIEMLLSGKIIEENDLSWTSSVNFSMNTNEVLALAEGQKTLTIAESRTRTAYIEHRIGEPFAQVVAFDYARNASGQIVYDDAGLPQKGELIALGTGVHPYSGGWDNEFRYGSLTLGVLIDFKFGGKIFSATNAYMYGAGLHQETLVGREGGVQGPGSSKNADAQDYYGRIAGNIGVPFVYDASFIKLRQLSIGYDLPTSWLESTPVKKATFSIVGRNLGILMKKTPNIDPETNINVTNAQGLELAGVPPTRTVGFNLNLKF